MLHVNRLKVELVYWFIELFLMIGGGILTYNSNGSWLIWTIGLGVTIIGVSMMFLYIKIISDTNIFDCDFIDVEKKHEECE